MQNISLSQGFVMGLYEDQECEDIINERSPWEVVKGPSNEIAISSRYAIFYRKGSLDDIEATNNYGDTESVKELFPPRHWIFNIPEGSAYKFVIIKVFSMIFQHKREI
jgi:hypothetical protein